MVMEEEPELSKFDRLLTHSLSWLRVACLSTASSWLMESMLDPEPMLTPDMLSEVCRWWRPCGFLT